MFIFLFICSLLVPVSMIVLGWRWREKPPKNINSISGYRTTMSMKNQDTWTYAHKYWGKMNFALGIAELIGTVILFVLIRNSSNYENIVVYLVFIQMGVMTLTIIPTEIKMNSIFTKDGKRK